MASVVVHAAPLSPLRVQPEPETFTLDLRLDDGFADRRIARSVRPTSALQPRRPGYVGADGCKRWLDSRLGTNPRDKIAYTRQHQNNLLVRVLGILAMCGLVAQVQPSCYLLLVQFRIPARSRKVGVEAVGFPSHGSSVRGILDWYRIRHAQLAQVLLENAANHHRCGILVLLIDKMPRHFEKIREHLSGYEPLRALNPPAPNLIPDRSENTERVLAVIVVGVGQPLIEFAVVTVVAPEGRLNERKAGRSKGRPLFRQHGGSLRVLAAPYVAQSRFGLSDQLVDAYFNVFNRHDVSKAV
jgi:hypothetical protein